MSFLLSIAVRNAHRAPMVIQSEATVTKEKGIEGDYRGHIKQRQVTVLSREAWEEACAEIGTNLPWTTRRANLLIEGINLENSTGKRLHIGDVILEITGETNPCIRMDEAHQKLCKALTPFWRGGVISRITQDGIMRTGNSIQIETVVSSNNPK